MYGSHVSHNYCGLAQTDSNVNVSACGTLPYCTLAGNLHSVWYTQITQCLDLRTKENRLKVHAKPPHCLEASSNKLPAFSGVVRTEQVRDYVPSNHHCGKPNNVHTTNIVESEGRLPPT